VGQLVVGDDLVEEAEREAQRPRQSRQREEHVEEGGAPVASQQVGEREPEEDGDDHRGLWVAQDDQRHDQDTQSDAQRAEDEPTYPKEGGLFTGVRGRVILRSCATLCNPSDLGPFHDVAGLESRV
jgi:hypothetical protein